MINRIRWREDEKMDQLRLFTMVWELEDRLETLESRVLMLTASLAAMSAVVVFLIVRSS